MKKSLSSSEIMETLFLCKDIFIIEHSEVKRERQRNRHLPPQSQLYPTPKF